MKRLFLSMLLVTVLMSCGMGYGAQSSENVPILTVDQLQNSDLLIKPGEVFVVKAPKDKTIIVDAFKAKFLITWNNGNVRNNLYQANTTLPISQDIIQID